MDLQKTKIYLDKLNREFARMQKDPENIVRLDVDIMLDHIRQLYDSVLSEVPAPVVVVRQEPEHHTKRHTPHHRTTHEEAPAPTPVAPPPVARVEPVAPAPAPPTPVVVETPPPPPPVVVEPPAPPAPEPVTYVPPTPPPVVVPEQVFAPEPVRSTSATTSEIDLLFEERQAKELSEKLSELPIADLRKAIALNDRLLLTRELFSGDGQAFDAALTALNSFSGMQEAKEYLTQNAVVRFGWLDKKRTEAAKNFIKLVRRRYK